MGHARYDGHAEWYDEAFGCFDADSEEAAFLGRHLGRSSSSEACLDVACGTGRASESVAEAGYTYIGADFSADQIRVGRQRISAPIRSDGRSLPIRSASLRVAIGLYFHTDVEDFAGVVTDVARCLRPGGRFLYIGLHPCFIGPFLDRSLEDPDKPLPLSTGYGESGWATRGSGGATGLWSRVGGHHKTLSAFVNAFAGSLAIAAIEELPGGGIVVPRNIAVVAEKH